MSHVYCPLNRFKAALRQDGTNSADDRDPEFEKLLESVSRGIDRYCRRSFGPTTATRELDGNGLTELWLHGMDDLISVSTLKLDEDGDGTYETTLSASTDYLLWPPNRYPKRRLDVRRLTSSQIGGWPNTYPRQIQLTGVFGYALETESVTTLAEALDTSETAIDVASSDDISIGNTLLVDSEQMYVSDVGTTLTVKRAQNGTTAASHDTAATVYIYRYERDIEEATLDQASRYWRERSAGGVGSLGGEFGYSFATLYPAIKDMLERHRHRVV